VSPVFRCCPLDDIPHAQHGSIGLFNSDWMSKSVGLLSRLRGKQRGAVEDAVAVFALIADDDGDKGKPANARPIEPTLLVESSPGNTHPWIFLTKAVTPKDGVALGAR
jgi:hypothetical protein